MNSSSNHSDKLDYVNSYYTFQRLRLKRQKWDAVHRQIMENVTVAYVTILIPDKVLNVYVRMVSMAMAKHVIRCLNAVRPFTQTVRVKISPFIHIKPIHIKILNNMISFVIILMISQSCGDPIKSTKPIPVRVIQQILLLHGSMNYLRGMVALDFTRYMTVHILWIHPP